MTPGTLDFKDITRKDTFEELTLALRMDGAPIDLTGAFICMQSKLLGNNGRPAHTWAHEVADAPGGILKFTRWVVNLAAGTYEHDLYIRLADGFALTYFRGKMKVNQNVSECQ